MDQASGSTQLRHQLQALSDADAATLVLVAVAALTDSATLKVIGTELRTDEGRLTAWTERVLLPTGATESICSAAELVLVDQVAGQAPSRPPEVVQHRARPAQLVQVMKQETEEADPVQLERAADLMYAWQLGRETAPAQMAEAMTKLHELFSADDAEALAEFQHGHQDRPREASVA